jgi:hypothetical protein
MSAQSLDHPGTLQPVEQLGRAAARQTDDVHDGARASRSIQIEQAHHLHRRVRDEIGVAGRRHDRGRHRRAQGRQLQDPALGLGRQLFAGSTRHGPDTIH